MIRKQDHICETWKYGSSVEVEYHKGKFDWKSMKRECEPTTYFVQRCFICGKVISKVPMSAIVSKRSAH
jgi:hypothetical protein